MAKKKMIRQLILPFIIIITTSLLILTWYSFSSLKTFYLDETHKSLLSKSYIFESQATSLLTGDEQDYNNLQNICRQIGDSSKTRITIMLSNGKIVADSEEDPRKMENHNSRYEMRDALTGIVGYSTRYSNTLQRSMMYLAIPLKQNNDIIGVLRLSVTTQSIDITMNALILKNIFAVIIVALLAGLVAFFISKKISQPLEELKIGAERFAQGDFDNLLPVPDSEEIAQLAEAMNSMATELDKRIKIITRQGNEQKVILQNMIEGVVAVDKSEKIMIMNKTAGVLFDVDPELSKGKSVYEVIRTPELQNIISSTLQTSNVQEGEISFGFENEKSISYTSSILKGDSGDTIGTLLVLNDLTRLRQLENIRKDFVANVSHELRTPITSIKGFVETLIEGGTTNQDDTNRFLSIISKQVDRLTSIIEDLLSLSRIEQDLGIGDISFTKVNILDVIQSSIEICAYKAQDKNVQIILRGDEKIEAEINIPLFEQAIINLLDNAIKYSTQDSHANIELLSDSTNFKVIVSDEGMGIETKHLPRLFERFYRVDKARSRELGGTGLGLAIVKHILLSHKGSVSVESKVGTGTNFTLTIPLSR